MNIDTVQELLSEALAENQQLKRLASELGRLVIVGWLVAEREGRGLGAPLPERLPLGELPALVGPALEGRLRELEPAVNGAGDARPH